MPAYQPQSFPAGDPALNVSTPVTNYNARSCIYPGGLPATLVNAEQLGAGVNSIPVNIGDARGEGAQPVVVTFTYNGVPGAVEYDIYVAMDDSLGFAGYTMVGKTTNVAGDQVTLQRSAAGGNMFRWLLVQEKTSPGVNATVKVYE